jgi:hypothetical protein
LAGHCQRVALLAIAGIALGACGASPSAATSSPATASTSASAASPLASAAASPFAGRINLPSISANDTDSFGIDISGTGSVVSNVDIKSRFGTVSLAGQSVEALVYEKIPWSDFSFVIYQAVAVQAHALTVFWFYCKGSTLTDAFWESTTSSKVLTEPMTGTCTSAAALNVKVSWPALSMAVPAAVAGFRAQGPGIDVGDASPGSALLDGRTWTLYPYAIVDCSKICGASGWYELHSLLWESKTGSAAYGILYLFPGQPNEVRLSYGLELRTLRRLADTTYNNSVWSHSP